MPNNFWLKKINNNKILEVKKLEGGVSSEVYKVRTYKNFFCVKRCLPKLLVKKDWYADIKRLKYEYYWLKHCKRILPKNIPKIYKFNENKNYLILEFLDEKKFVNFKSLLLSENIDQSIFINISKKLNKIHRLSKKNYVKRQFEKNWKNFYDLRLDAYFNETGRVHSKFLPRVKKIITNYKKNSKTLVHGDFSPKNIMINKKNMIFLDAETSNFGDPVFDVVFFTNHLLIKSIYLPQKKNNFLLAYKNFFEEYIKLINWEDKKKFFERCLEMIPLMLMARVDGKSPVEYITKIKDKNKIRKLSTKLLHCENFSLEQLLNIYNNE